MADFTAIVVAAIAAGPPTLAAYLSYRKAQKIETQVTPSNGTKTATLLEQAKEKIDSISRRLEHHIDEFEEHLADERVHRLAQAEHIQEQHRERVCEYCGCIQ